MLCCGRKKGRLDQEPSLSASRFFQNICITSNHPFEHQSPTQTHRSLLDHSTFSRSKQPLQGDKKRHQQKQRCLYSRSYPESEAVAFGGRPLLHDRSMERNTRTAGGHRQRGHEKYSQRNDHKALVPCHNKPLSNNSTWKSKENHHLDMGIKSIETFVDYTTVETVEINKRPGQTLGFYIREGNGIDRTDGVFISRIAAGSAVERNGLLRVGEEILAIDGLGLKGVCLDDVVILMSIPSRLLLTVKTRRSCCKNLSCPSLPLTPTTKSPLFLLPTDFRAPLEQPQVFAKKKFQHQMAINPPYMQHPFYPPYQPPLPQTSLQKSFFPPLPSFQQQEHYYDPYLRPLKTIKPTYKDFYYGHKQPKQSWYQVYNDPLYDVSHLPSSGYYGRYSSKDSTRRVKKQVESLDRKIQGVNGRKNRKLDYFSDGETQMACEYLYGIDADKYCYDLKDSKMDENNDDFAGVKKLSRSLSRRKKSSKMNLDRWKFEQKQLSLEKQIERQEQQLYLLQQQLKLELQNQKHPLTRDEEIPPQTYYKPILRQKSSFPSYSNQYDHDQPASTYFQQNSQPYYPPLQFEHDAHLYDLNDFKSKQKLGFDIPQIIKSNFHDDYTFNHATPSHRKRYSSDSDIQNGNGNGNYMVVTSSPSTAALEIVSGILSNNEKSNSLPAEIENGALSSNGDDPNQLKHWLRKLDRLSYDLREFNGRLKNGSSLKTNGKEKSLKLNGNEYKKAKYQAPTIFNAPTSKPLTRSALYDNYNDEKKFFKAEKKSFDYSSEEYKSWLYDRRLQNKLKKERTEKYQQHTPSILQQQRQQQRLKPISSRDRAKLALSESRQRMAQSQFGPKSELKQKQGSHHAHILKKKLTATASQTTPSIHTGKSKSRSLDHDFDEGTYELSSGVFTASKSKTLEKANGHFYDSHNRNTHSFDLSSYQAPSHQVDLHSDMKRRHRHQNSLPEADRLMGTEQLETDRRDNISESGINDMNLDEMGVYPELLDPDSKEFQQMYGQNLPKEHNNKKINGEKLKTEPMKIKVGEFHPHQNDDGDHLSSKHNGKNKCGTKNGKHKNNKNKHILEKEALKNKIEENKRALDYQNLDTFSGSMYVKIFCGHGLKSPRRTVLRDLYCVLSVDGESKARTAAKTGAINFDWDEDFEIDLSDSHTVNFSIYSWDPVARQRLCYTAQLIIEDFIFIHGHERRLAMKLQPSGTLYVELKYRNMAEKFTRVPIPAENAIFGAVLDDLIARETSIYVKNGSNAGSLSRVPRFVRACVYEVELRGLDSMGIYRLSGSYTRLNKLKQKLEEHYNGSGKGADNLAWNGNEFENILSANSVPDINIVAGLLKSLLLELPDPLMCGDLYDMFIDAVKLQMQEDFSASVSLMLSVLDCLPKNNLAVFSFLMDHLKKVEQEKNLNMMNSKSLGEIFGPLLLCPPISDNGHLRHQRHKRYRTSSSVSLSDQAQVIAYLIDIWPSQ